MSGIAQQPISLLLDRISKRLVKHRLNRNLTQVELATMVGATRESVNKAVSVLRDRKLVDFDGTRWFLIDPAGMKQILYERGR